MRRPAHLRRRAPPGGFTLIEILIASVVLAFAMIPVFGLMTTGAVRTDLNIGYTNAVEISSGIMNQLLSEETPFSILPDSGGNAQYPDRGSAMAAAQGNVIDDAALDVLFPAPDWTVTPEGTRSIRINGIRYQVMLWVGMYDDPTDIQLGYYRSPILDLRDPVAPRRFDCVKVISNADWQAGYSPYSRLSIENRASNPASRVVSFPWAQPESEVVEDATQYGDPGQPGNFAKLVLRVSWGEDLRRGRGQAKDFYLVSFKADLQE